MRDQADAAVALQYTEDLPAPIILASGRGMMAEAIMRIARENGVAFVENTDLAETLLSMDPGTLIPESLYEVIAEIFAFVRSLRTEK